MAKGSFEGFPNPKPNKGGTNTGDANAVASHILAGESAYVRGVKVNGTMPDNSGSGTITPVSVATDAFGGIYMRIPTGAYLVSTGGGNFEAYTLDPDFIAANIPLSINMFGLVGTGVNVKRFATGTATSGGASTNTVTVTGLAFIPRLVALQRPGSVDQLSIGMKTTVFGEATNGSVSAAPGATATAGSVAFGASNFSINASVPSVLYNWIAYE